ncbi:MAG: hypothetical protein ACP5N2_07740 [Candidatus Nanoarchaeia archaeon]
MVFHMLAGLFSILSSSLIYVAGAIIFSKQEETLVAFIGALIIITVVLFLVRLLFFKGEHRLKYAMRSMRPSGFMMRRMARTYKHTHDRKVISGSVARILAFGLIFYLMNHSLMILYGAAAFALITGIIALAAFRHKLVDLFSGTILGVAAGFISIKYVPLLMTLIGI